MIFGPNFVLCDYYAKDRYIFGVNLTRKYVCDYLSNSTMDEFHVSVHCVKTCSHSVDVRKCCRSQTPDKQIGLLV